MTNVACIINTFMTYLRRDSDIKIGPRVVSCQSIEILRVRLWNQNCPFLFKNDDFVLTLSDAEASNFGGGLLRHFGVILTL